MAKVMTFLTLILLLLAGLLFAVSQNLEQMVSQTEKLLQWQKELRGSSAQAKELLEKQEALFEELAHSAETTEKLLKKTERLKRVNGAMEKEEAHIDRLEKQIVASLPTTLALAEKLSKKSKQLRGTMQKVTEQLLEAKKAQTVLYRYTRKQARLLKKIPAFLLR